MLHDDFSYLPQVSLMFLAIVVQENDFLNAVLSCLWEWNLSSHSWKIFLFEFLENNLTLTRPGKSRRLEGF